MTLDLPLASLDEALDSVDALDADAAAEHVDELVAYVLDHVEMTGSDGVWTETATDAATTTIKGIEHLSVNIAFDSAGADAGTYTLTYDAIIDSHEVTVITIDDAGDFALAGVLTQGPTRSPSPTAQAARAARAAQDSRTTCCSC